MRGREWLVAAVALAAVARANAAPPTWDLWRADDTPRVSRAIQNDRRTAIALAAPARRAFTVTIPPHATLELGYAVTAPGLPERPAAARVRVAFDSGDGVPRVLHERTVDPASRPLDARWADLRLDLGLLTGATGQLIVEAEPAPPDTAPLLLLSAARVVTPAESGEPNLLLVTIDCLRADHLGAYGYTRPTSPALDRLAHDGVRFANAFANAPMTMPSMPQLFASRLFPTPADPTFAAALVQAGIPTAAIVNNAWITLWLSLMRDPTREPIDRLVAAEGWNAGRITDAALAWIDGHGDARWALHLHYLDAHSPYLLYPPAADRFGDPAYRGPVTAAFDDVAGARQGRYDAADQARVVSLYDAGIRYVDDELGRLLDRLRADGRLDRTVVVVTADHGEELWDHGAFFHGQSLHDELLHVPLIVRLPGGAHAGTRVDTAVQLLDVAPSLLDWAGLPPAPSFAGRRLREVIDDPTAPAIPLVATAVNPQFPIRYGIRTPAHAVVEHLASARRTLFELGTDPAERHDVAALHPATVDESAAALDAARAPLRQRGFQVQVAGDGRHVVALRLDDDHDGRFTTLDRTGPFGSLRLAATRMGRGARAKGVLRNGQSAVGFRFDRRVPPFLGAAEPDRVRLTAIVDGRALPGDAIVLGPAFAPSHDGGFDTRDAQLASAAPPPCSAPSGAVRVCVWRAGAAVADAAPPESTRERLRALGYAP